MPQPYTQYRGAPSSLMRTSMYGHGALCLVECVFGSMFAELPLARQLECELRVRAVQEKGLQQPESLLNYTLSLIRRNYNLEHSVLTALGRIGELQVELALATTPQALPLLRSATSTWLRRY